MRARTLYIQTGSPWGERLHRELQREVEGRTTGQEDLRHTDGGEGADGALQAGLQPGPAATVRWDTQASSAGDLPAC